ncbi:MAG: hypothetical protein AABW80_00705 [Nanoarchaeota archaeon]
MQKGALIFSSIVLSLVLFLSLVVAAGTSTGRERAMQGDNDSLTDEGLRVQERGVPVSNSTCDSFSARRERIHCRLTENTFEGNASIEESCRNAFNVRACERLYVTADRCYALEGRNKDQCFKRVAGFQKAQLAQEAKTNATSVRNYMVLVLYNMQSRVEKASEDGLITTSQAATLIDQIVSTKEGILTGKSKAEIRAEVSSLKEQWRGIMKDIRTASRNAGNITQENETVNE